ncbi:response regulator [Fontimonas sp. SYSU GA230001]|uniref:response regulator n=1 Tax=Fontimonas sp. SYSU GA230001 TaxID=3142450 RepID=UPI0032B3456A
MNDNEDVRPTVLCVDDEPNILGSLSLLLKRSYTVLTATSGAAGITLMRQRPEIDVVISDMRMPGMDGAKFLHAARSISADAPRILLTGQADLDAAIAAVNDGQIFRFLMKPCPPATLLGAVEAALRYRQLVQAERVLLQQTLTGAVQALVNVLAMRYPSAFGAAERVKRRVARLAKTMVPELAWALEIAALLRPLGTIALPDAVADKLYDGSTLDAVEQAMVARTVPLTDQLIAHIPRLQTVRALLALAQDLPVPAGCEPTDAARADHLRAAQILRAAVDFDRLLTEGFSATAALHKMLAQKAVYGLPVLEALDKTHGRDDSVGLIQEVLPHALRPGMVIARDVVQNNGVLLVARGYEVTPGLVERIRNLPPGALTAPIQVEASPRERSATELPAQDGTADG